jgi:catechol 2,3-dioxygenase-like lactoylglutathione lyase family enzyme
MADWKLLRFVDTIINARDLQETVDFYQSIGFRIVHDRRNLTWPEKMAALFGLKRAAGGGVLMEIPNGGDSPTMLNIMHWREPQAEFPDPTKVETSVPRLYVFQVDNVKAAYADIQKRGMTITRGGLFEPDTPMALVGSFFFYDPNGNLVEFLEYKPGARHSQDLKS